MPLLSSTLHHQNPDTKGQLNDHLLTACYVSPVPPSSFYPKIPLVFMMHCKNTWDLETFPSLLVLLLSHKKV